MTLLQRTIAQFFLLQSVAVPLWWLLLWCHPPARVWFFPGPPAALWSLLPGDLLITLLSLGAGLAAFRQHAATTPLMWAACGAVAYAAALPWWWALTTGRAWFSVVLMSLALLFSFWGAYGFDRPLFARAKHGAAFFWRALAQGAVFWLVFLGAVPAALWQFEGDVGLARFTPWPAWLCLLLALFAAALNLGAMAVMVRHGEGTPLPLEGPNRLVCRGPFAYVRNPMAVGGLGLALVLGLYLGSPGIVAYVLVGAGLWHWLMRPLEEEDLRATFGPAYDHYRRQVRCWWPRRSAYVPPSDATVG